MTGGVQPWYLVKKLRKNMEILTGDILMKKKNEYQIFSLVTIIPSQKSMLQFQISFTGRIKHFSKFL
jgi:hypothetical protein